jgi:AhpD family alkylhydroperoxidase
MIQPGLPEEIQDKLIDIGMIILQDGALDPKTKALIAVSTATATSCTHCRGRFKATASQLGATEEQIDEAERLALRMRERCRNESGIYLISRATVDS